MVTAERNWPEWLKETRVRVAERGYGEILGRLSYRTTQAATGSRPATDTACSK
jgi:hypothetical protein